MSYQAARSRRYPRRPHQLAGLGRSLKPPRFARKAARAVGRVVRSGAAITLTTLVPGAGLVIGSRKAPRFLRAPKGVRPFVRTVSKVELAAGAVAAAAIFAPELLPAAGKLLPFVARFLPTKGSTSPGPTASSTDYGPGYGGGGGDGSGGSAGGGGSVDADPGAPTVDAEPAPAAAGGGALAIGALILGGLLLARHSTRKA